MQRSHPWIECAPAFQVALLAWYDANQRQLPWRIQPTLYKTVVSEFMLQQTQVVTVLPYFNRWLQVFPDFSALASASEALVLKHWEGLGYYSRARNLKKLAEALVAMPRIPDKPSAWEALPGVGPYTSAAISSIAQGYPAAVVDGNVVRILTRLLADNQPFRDLSQANRLLEPVANGLINFNRPGDHNQAMMELGATLCTKANPQCEICPVRSFCRGYATGDIRAYPNLIRKASTRRLVNRGFCFSENSLLLEKKPATARRLANIYELPTLEVLGIAVPEGQPMLIKKRGIALELIEERFFAVQPESIDDAKLAACQWVSQDQLEAFTLSGPHRRWLEDLLEIFSKGLNNTLF